MRTFSRFFAISIALGLLSFGGLLALAQTSGVGSTFIVTLPLAKKS